MKPQNQIPDPVDELSWRSFCYINGELTAEEEEQFEQRLSQDQSAREAVAEAVRQQQLINRALQPTTEVSSRSTIVFEPSNRMKRRSWKTVVTCFSLVAAILLVAVFLRGGFGGANPAGRTVELAQTQRNATELSLSEAEELIQQDVYVIRLADALQSTSDVNDVDWEAMTESEEVDSVMLDGEWLVEAYSEIETEWMDDDDAPEIDKSANPTSSKS